MASNKQNFPDVVELNVGGVFYTTSLITLTKCKSNMLSAMFSGHHQVFQDKDGRYFIDADGDMFAHILRYLRSGNLPSSSIAPQVYREATYFCLEDLQRQIEQMPTMMGRQARIQVQSQLRGFDDAVDNILEVASKNQCIISDEIVSYAVISILREQQEVLNPAFDNNHRCQVNLPLETTFADVVIGPWNEKVQDLTDKVYLRAIARELEFRGFTVTCSKLGTCSYGIINPDIINCKKALFKLIFHWHKCC